MTPQPSYHDWPTKAEAAQALQTSTRGIERMAKDGKMGFAYRPVPGRRPCVVYNPDDLARLAGEKHGALAAIVSPIFAPSGSAALSRGFSASEVSAIIESFSAAAGPVPLKEKLYLSIDEAVEYSGLPASYLYKAIRESRLLAVKADRWVRISRKDLERL